MLHSNSIKFLLNIQNPNITFEENRQNVKTVTIDMNPGYVSVIKELLPQANIIIDHFHLVQLINRSMNKCRINIMKKLETDPHDNMKKYRRLKRYWKLLLKK